MAQNDIYLVRQKADGTFEEIANSPFQYDATSITDLPDKSNNTFHINTKLRVDELEVNGQTTVIHTDTNTSEQLIVTNDGTGPAAIINQLGQQALIDIQDDGASALYIRGDSPFGGFVGLGNTSPEEQLHLSGSILLENEQLLMSKNISGTKVNVLGLSDEDVTNLNNVGNGITLSTGTASAEERVFIHPSGRVGIGILKNDPGAVLELKRDSDTNLLLTHKTTSISSIINIDKPEDKVVFKTLSDNDLSLGTNALDFFTLTKDGNITLEKKTVGSTATGGDLTIDGTFTSKGDMISIGSEEILFSKSLTSSGMNVAKSYKVLQVGYNTHHWDHGTSFIIEIYSNHFGSQGYQKYLLSHTYIDTSASGSQDGIVDKAGSRDYVLKILEQEGKGNLYEFRARLGAPEDTGVNVSDRDVALIPLYVDVNNFANVRVKITSFNSDSCKRISVDANWGAGTADDEFKFDPLPSAEDITWSDYPDLPGTTDYVVAGRQALYADVLFGDGRINRIGERTTHQNNIQWALKLADTNTSLTVAGKVGIGTSSPDALLDVGGSLDELNSAQIKNLSNTGYGIMTQGGGSGVYRYVADFRDKDGTSRLKIDGNGNVGIGTISPGDFESEANHLVIKGQNNTGMTICAGNTTSRSNIYFADGTSGDQQYRGGITYDHGTDDLSLRAGGVEYMWVADGKVGICTASPTQTLTVDGNLLLNKKDVDGGNQALLFSSGGAADHPLLRIYDKDGDTGAAITANGNSYLSAKGGNVGIGTTDPDHPLTVMSGGNMGGVRLVGKPNNDNHIRYDYPSMTRAGSTGTSTAIGDVDHWVAGVDTNSSHENDFIFWNSDRNNIDLAIEHDTGNVGIGTASPAAHLHVVGQGYFSRSSSTSAPLYAKQEGTGPSAYFIGGNVGVGAVAPVEKLHVSAGKLLVAAYDIPFAAGDGPVAGATFFSRREPDGTGTRYGSGIDIVPISEEGHCSPFIRFYDSGANGDYDDATTGDSNWAMGADDQAVSTFRINWGGGSDSPKPLSIRENTPNSGTPRLSIDGPTGNLKLFNGDIYMPSNIRHVGDGTTYFGFHGNASVGVTTNGSQRLLITDASTTVNNVLQANGGMTIATNEDNNTPELTLKRYASTNSSGSDDIVDIRVSDGGLNFIINNDADLDTGTYQFQKMVNGSTVPAAISCDAITAAGDLIVEGDLTVNGDLVTLNTTNLQIEDKLLTVAKNATNAATADGCGLDFGGQYKLTFEEEATNKLVIEDTADNTASLEIQGFGGAQLILQDTNASNTTNQSGSIEWKLGNDTVTGAVGFLNNSDSDFAIKNVSGDILLDGDTKIKGGLYLDSDDGFISLTQKHTGAELFDYLHSKTDIIEISTAAGTSNTTKANAHTETFTIPGYPQGTDNQPTQKGVRYYIKLKHRDAENGARFAINGSPDFPLSYNSTPTGNMNDDSFAWSTFDITDYMQTSNTLYFWASTADGANIYDRYVFASSGIALPNEPVEQHQVFTRGLTSYSGSWNNPGLHLKGSEPTIKLNDTTATDDFYIHVNSNNFYILVDRDATGQDDPIDAASNVWETPEPLVLEGDTNKAYAFGSQIVTAANAASLGIGGSSADSAITTNGSVPSLASGITAAEVRSLIGAGTGSGTVTSVNVGGKGLELTGTGTVNPTIKLDFTELTLAPLVINSWDFIFNDGVNSDPTRVNYNKVVQSIGIDLSPDFVGTDAGMHTMQGTLDVTGTNNNESIRASGDIVAMSTSASDDALKTNKVAIDGALDKVCSLNGFTFDWNEKAAEIGIQDEGSIGLSAQEIEKVVPEVVKPLSNTEYKYVNYEKLVPVLVEAIKELKSEIEQLKSNQCDC